MHPPCRSQLQHIVNTAHLSPYNALSIHASPNSSEHLPILSYKVRRYARSYPFLPRAALPHIPRALRAGIAPDLHLSHIAERIQDPELKQMDCSLLRITKARY
jgi:hypothetical protein